MLRLSRSALLALVFLAGLSACGDGEPALPRTASQVGKSAVDDPAAVSADAPLVVFLGDSISAGLGVDPENAFPARLQRELAAEGKPFRLVNAGVSGDTSAGGLRRLDWLLGQHPSVLVVELGGNDGLRGQAPAEIEARLREIAERSAAAGARVLLLGVRLPPSLGADYVREFEAIYPRLADELGVDLAPFFMEGAVSGGAGLQDDGIHPTAAGHARIAESLAPRLAEILASLESAAR